ncbi:hypothetical protein, partial [Staphylococcus xylosus]|uniref:hypothetical protein n=1 Tax=Staphylococcus xylosus TaxID=1288 RepID=UPI001C70B345
NTTGTITADNDTVRIVPNTNLNKPLIKFHILFHLNKLLTYPLLMIAYLKASINIYPLFTTLI